jgi:hypothetical protein
MTKVYRPIVDGYPLQMLAVSGLSQDEAFSYCRGIFGARFEGFA